jgi:hypothetical protein
MPFLAPLGAALIPATAGTAAATAVGVGATALGGLAIGGLAKGLFSSPDTPSLPALPAAPSQAGAEKASRAEAVAEQRAKLRGSKTNLTGGSLLAPLGPTTQKTLLGA